MKIVIVGMGYVGVTSAACLSLQGNNVFGVDTNNLKVELLKEGNSPITEPGVEELIRNATDNGLFKASTEIPNLEDIDAIVVCVGTPSKNDGSHDLSYISQATQQIVNAASFGFGESIAVIYRSTFPPGTMDNLILPMFSQSLGVKADQIELIYNPEFLRESTAIDDYFDPPKIVAGTSSGKPSKTIELINQSNEAPIFTVGYKEAELTKFIDNTWHAVKVGFANEIGRISTKLQLDTEKIHKIFVSDTKLNISSRYLRPGAPFGGSCLPKDVRAIQRLSIDEGIQTPLIQSLLLSNEQHKHFSFAQVTKLAGIRDRILVVGISFKYGTDDLRESPYVDLISSLVKKGYNVRIYDPFVDVNKFIGTNLEFINKSIPNIKTLIINEAGVLQSEFDLVVLTDSSAAIPELGSRTKTINLGTIK